MRVTALGTSAAYPGPDNACTGWLVEDDGARVLVDCGTGVLSRLQTVLHPSELTGVVISHMHADHFFDLFPLRYAFKYALGCPEPKPVLYLPPGGGGVLSTMAGALDAHEPEAFFHAVFDVREFDPEQGPQLNGLSLQFAPGRHYVPCWAIRVAGERCVVFTADTGPSDTVAGLARNADLLISEATYLSLDEEQGGVRGHMTGLEAGQLAAQAEPKSVLLTHHWPNRDPRASLDQARSVYRGDIGVAEPGRTYQV